MGKKENSLTCICVKDRHKLAPGLTMAAWSCGCYHNKPYSHLPSEDALMGFFPADRLP